MISVAYTILCTLIPYSVVYTLSISILCTHCYIVLTTVHRNNLPRNGNQASIPFFLFLSSSLLLPLLCSPQFAFDTLLSFPFFSISLACDSWLDPVSYILLFFLFRPSHFAPQNKKSSIRGNSTASLAISHSISYPSYQLTTPAQLDTPTMPKKGGKNKSKAKAKAAAPAAAAAPAPAKDVASDVKDTV